ncbi:Hydroxyisourate hydrolase [Pyrenochaeta sp. DS3sAY3a]|nr:Hydroxyisourate hydrolase [Pyrenochaeta sp. DS3sAY3a]
MATESKPPITCHVLDTTLGKPAAGIPVVLTLHGSTGDSSAQAQGEVKFSGTTNSDGRVTSWTPPSTSPSPSSSSSLSTLFHSPGTQKYSLTFDTDEYFGQRGIKTFFPEVEVKFVVRAEAKGEHYHVPVLLGPFGYTTYRGS